MQGQSKYSQCCGYSRSKRYLWCLDKTGAGEGPPPELWETDRTLERQKRKDIYFKLGQNRNKIQSRKWAWSSGNQTLWNTDLEMGSKSRKEGWCLMTEVENWCPVLWEVESHQRILVRWMKWCLLKLTCDVTQELETYLVQERQYWNHFIKSEIHAEWSRWDGNDGNEMVSLGWSGCLPSPPK